MTDRQVQLEGTGTPVFRRSIAKADGRMLHLYGRAPHDLPLQQQDSDPVATGGELRHHPLRDEWNVYAAHRQNRTYKPAASADPLAPTLPDGLPTEIPFADFELAVFDNKFAAFHSAAPDPSPLPGIGTKPATGACEVVVYTPEAEGSLHTIGQDRRALLLSAWIDRTDVLFAAGCRCVLPFENRGEAVGTTLHHPHGQIYGFPHVPRVQQRAADAFARGYDLSAEIEALLADYGIAREGGVTAWCPRFARFPYEVWIAPDIARAQLADCTAEERDGIAALMGDVTRRYDALFGQAMPAMMAVHTAPADHAAPYHLTIQFYPLLRGPDRVKYLASVEQHAGIFTVDIMPETAAAALRAL
ncbi:MAG: galactose-1-phosphate uridylyltransferase [Parerythrobacter sp.]